MPAKRPKIEKPGSRLVSIMCTEKSFNRGSAFYRFPQFLLGDAQLVEALILNAHHRRQFTGKCACGLTTVICESLQYCSPLLAAMEYRDQLQAISPDSVRNRSLWNCRGLAKALLH